MSDITPGNWDVEEGYRHQCPGMGRPLRIYSDEPGPSLPYTIAFVEGHAGIKGDVGDANARLIITAPELYQVAKKLVFARSIGDILTQVIPMAEAAVHKVEGREVGRSAVRTDPPQRRNAACRISRIRQLFKAVKAYFTFA